MKTVCKVNNCTGCMACLDVCSKGAIVVADNQRYFNAVIDTDRCINCGVCHRVCQNNSKIDVATPVVWYQGWSKSDIQRRKSSSGGFAAELAKCFIKNGGIVCSCTFNNGFFGFSFADSSEDTEKFVGSKYVKSNPKGIYKKINALLSENRKVLFIGLPCQAAAVKQFVGNKFQNNLYLVDLICHGSPSPKHLDKFLKESGYRLDNLDCIGFRKKDSFRITQNEQYIETSGVYDCYTLAFLNGLNYTENCYNCKFAKKERVSDITIGDSWGSDLSVDEQQKGISLALCRSEKGHELLKKSNIFLFPVNLENAIKNNQQLETPSRKPDTYDKFFHALEVGKSYRTAVKISLPRTYRNQQIKKILIKLKIMRGGEINCYAITIFEKDKKDGLL